MLKPRNQFWAWCPGDQSWNGECLGFSVARFPACNFSWGRPYHSSPGSITCAWGGWKQRAGDLRAARGFLFIRDVGGAKSPGLGCWETDTIIDIQNILKHRHWRLSVWFKFQSQASFRNQYILLLSLNEIKCSKSLSVSSWNIDVVW